MFSVGGQRLVAARAEALKNGGVAALRPVGEAALEFGKCVTKCFVEEKNGDGFCYEKKSVHSWIVTGSSQHQILR
ncbi:hypothetical protein GCK32_019556 [Trichostrongylus colubriformis]|uniref:Uncharacterized protein n=1 Tax=Trichostrongylus colubriformis TaxID=6319 RepID=A0AAN8F2C1_TRICO